jgi:hypothetical protein
MTIQDILNRLAKLSTNWPRLAVQRTLQLNGILALEQLETDELVEYNLLLTWLYETVEAGVAFKQQSLVEH